MSKSFYNVTRKEMESFLLEQNFKPLSLKGVVELVYGKIITLGKHKISKRVYTAIWPNGVSRERGSDSIRVQLYWMFDGEPTFIGRTYNVRRLKTWNKNLEKAIVGIEQEYKECACGAPMVLRNGKYGEFWGCSTYHKTKCDGKAQNTVPQNNKQAPVPVEKPKIEQWDNPKDGMNAYRIAPSKISQRQKRAEQIFRNQTQNMMLPSRAGGGKTTMLKHLASFRGEKERFVYQAFNSKNAADARKKFPRGCWAMTTHSHLFGVLKENLKFLPEKADNKKNYTVMQEVYPLIGSSDTKIMRKRIRKAAMKMIGLSKNHAVRPGDVELIKQVMDKYDFDLESDNEYQTVVEVVNECLNLSLPGKKYGSIFDYDDMLWWWVCLELAPKSFDVSLLDEVQDFNECQIEMVRRMLNKGTRIVAVGDPYQAMYRFRGADSAAYHKLEEILHNDKRGCESVLLPTNYRSGKNIINFVVKETIVKDIEAAPDAIDGEVRVDMTYDQILDAMALEFA